MNHTRAIPLLFVLGSAVLSQTPGKQFAYQPTQPGCPVELKASWDGVAKLLPVDSHPKEKPMNEQSRLRIALSNPTSAIASARVTVQGFPLTGRLQPAVLYLPDDPAEITKTVVLDRAVGLGQSTQFEVTLPDFGTVTSIDLDSVIYADGSTWHRGRRRECRAVGLPVSLVKQAISR